MNLFEREGKERAAIYTGFLNVKGKTMFDAIIAKPRLASHIDIDEYWVDVHYNDVQSLTKHLRRYAMRMDITIEDISSVIKSYSIQSLQKVPMAQPVGHFYKLMQDQV